MRAQGLPSQCWLNRAIICNETGKIYRTIAEVVRDLGLDYNAINNYLMRRRKSPVNGYTFDYAYDHILNGVGMGKRYA